MSHSLLPSRSRATLSRPLAALLALLLAFATIVATQPSGAFGATVRALEETYNETVNGDFVMIGNGNLVASGTNSQGIAQLHNGVTGYNDNFNMVNTGGAAGMGANSSSATITVPAGARVVHAELYWMGNTGRVGGQTRNYCSTNGEATLPSGSFTTQMPLVRVAGGAPRAVPASAATITQEPTVAGTNPYYYSGRADVTSLVAGLPAGSQQTVSVGNLWLPTGLGCFGGWSMSVVYDFGGYVAGDSRSSARTVILTDGHVRLGSSDAPLLVTFQGFVAGGEGVRASFSLGEGDGAIVGDAAAYRRTASGTPTPIVGIKGVTNNIAVGHTPTGVRYQGTGTAPFYNASIDVVDAPLTNVQAGDTSTQLQLSTSGDSYMLQSAAFSVPVADVEIEKTYTGTGPGAVDEQQILPGERPAFTIAVRNPGSTTLTDVTVTDPQAPECAFVLPTLAPGAEHLHPCEGPVANAGYTNTATVSATSAGTEVRDRADTSEVQVSTIGLEKFVASGADYTGRAGDQLAYTFLVRNTGTSTLSGIEVTDDMAGLEGLAVDWATSSNAATAAGALAPSESVRATATYTLTQADVDRGSVVNANARTRGTDAAGHTVEDAANATHPVPSAPALQLLKSGEAADGMPGDPVTYSFTATNAGNVTLSGVVITDPLPGLSGLTHTWPGAAGTLLPGQTVTATATAVLTQAQADAGGVDNTATVVGTPPSGPAVDAEASARVDVLQTPAIDIEKRGTLTGDGVAGDIVSYQLVVTNEGNATLTDVAVTDPLVAPGDIHPVGSWPGAVGTLLPGQSMSFSTTHALTQDEVDAGRLDNTASVSGTPPSGAAVTDEDSFTVPVLAGPGIELAKTGSLVLGGAGVADDRVEYEFEVTNNGNVTLTDVAVTDAGLGDAALTYRWPGEPGILAPGETVTATASVSVTQAQQDAGRASNTAKVTGTPPTGEPVDDIDTEVVPIVSLPALALDKDGSLSEGMHVAGDTVDYAFTVRNTGNVTLTDVVIDDDRVDGAVTMTWPGASGTLTPGASASGTAQYTLTQGDIDRGFVDNVAATTGAPPSGTPVTATDLDRVLVPQTSALTVDKTGEVAQGGIGVAGDTVEYRFQVVNAGNTTLTGVTVADPLPGLSTPTAAAWPGEPGTLAPGQSVAFTATRTLTQADVDAGGVDNTATALGIAPDGASVDGHDSHTLPVESAGTIVLEKTGSLGDGSAAGDEVTYEFVLRNTGPITLTDVAVTDTLEGLSTITYGAWPDAEAPGTLAPRQSVSAQATYTLTQADVDRGTVDNTATAFGVTTQGASVSDEDAARVELPATPGIALTKQPTLSGDGVAGSTIAYALTAENTGTVTLTGVTIADPLAGLSAPTYTWPGAEGTLAPGESVTATATYTVTQADVDRGSVLNAATASGTGVRGGDVSDAADAEVPLSQAASIELVKDAVLADAAPAAVGDTVDYSFLVRNTGDVTLTGVTIDDPMLPAGVVLGEWPSTAGTLAPGESVTATASWTLTQADLDRGGVTNTATASGNPPSGDPVADADDARTEIVGSPLLTLLKDGVLSGEGIAGDTIDYTFTITNDGTVTVRAIDLADDLVDDIAFGSWPGVEGELAPGQSVEATASYTVTQADADAGEVLNEATVTGTTDAHGTVEDVDDHVQPLGAAGGIEIDKSHDPVTGVVGDVIDYSFVVTNTGGVTLRDVTVSDELDGLSTLVHGAWPGEAGVLAPSQSVTVTAQLTLTQAHLDAGRIDNVATVTGTTPGDGPVEGTDDDSVPLTQTPAISLAKTSVVEGASAGDTVTYAFVAENTGNVTLDGVAIADGLAGLSEIAYGAWPGAEGVLAPGEQVSATATYELAQADIDAGVVVNDASVTGTTPGDAEVTDDASVSDPLASAAAMRLDKTATVGTAALDQVVTYGFELENTGNVTLTQVAIADPMAGLSALEHSWPGAEGVLAPGEIVTATATYTITQADVDAGGVRNAASGVGVPPTGDPVRPSDEVDVPIDAAPAIAIDKSGALTEGSVGAAGDEMTYAFVVSNTGDVTLTAIDVVDEMAGLSDLAFGSWPSAERILAPGESVTATATYTLTQADVDAGFVENTASTTGQPPSGDPVGDSDTERLETPGTIAISLDKAAAAAHGAASVAGDAVSYTFEIRNTGTRTLTDIVLTDPLAGLSAPVVDWSTAAVEGRLAPGEQVTASAAYTLTQADVDAGLVENTATIAAADLRGATVTVDDDADVALEGTPLVELDKSHVGAPTRVGELLDYRFEITNAGSVTLLDIRLTDQLAGLSQPVFDWSTAAVEGQLAPGETVVATAALAVTQAHLDAGTIVNEATASGTPAGGEPVRSSDDDAYALAQLPGIATSKAAALPEGSTGAVGDVVTYTIVVVNDGNVTLDGVAVTDPMFAAEQLSYDWSAATTEGALAPGESAVVTATRTLTQADVDAGRVDNVAVGSGTSPLGPIDDADDATITIVQSPAMTLAKTSSTDALPALGETVAYAFEAVNTGTVTLSDVSIVDPMPGLSALSYDWSDATVEGSLAPGESVTATATYVITQADVDAGGVSNAATATGTPPGGDPVVPGDTVTVEVPQHPAIALAKAGVLADGQTGVAGDTVRYAFEVRNTGDVTLSGVTIADPMPGLSDIAFGPWPGDSGVLAPGESVTASATYVLTQADVDAGSRDNVAVASATPPLGGVVTDEDTATVGADSSGAIDVEKTATVQGEGIVGDEIVFGFSAINTGTVTLSGVTLDDPLEGLGDIAYAWPGAEGVLAPGETVTATARYTLTQADIDSGEVDNAVVVTGGMPDGGEPVSDEDRVITPTPGFGSLSLQKSGEVDSDGTAQVGDVITYALVATNDGTLTLTDVVIDDPLDGLSELELTWPGEAGVLAPGASVTGTATYAVTQADIDAGAVLNAATASGQAPYGPRPEASVQQETPLEQRSELRFEKTAGYGGSGAVGDVIEYGFRLENAGTTTLTDVAVVDAMPGLSPLEYAWPDAERAGVLLPGETVTATASYALMQADIDAGSVHNAAHGTGQPPAPCPDCEAPAPLVAADETTTEIRRSAGISLTKVGAMEAGAIGEVGDRITYSFEVENTGTVTLTDVAIVDAMPGLSALTWQWPDATRPGVLLPGATATATASYELTAADLERDMIVNEAAASGVAPEGMEPPTSEDAATVDVPTAERPGTGLPQTGVEVPVPVIVLSGIVLLLIGIALLPTGRRRRS